MEIKKPKSHTPIIHDNTEEDLILVPPSVLKNKLNIFEDYIRVSATIVGEIGIILTLLIAILSADFKDVFGISGQSIQGAFIAALVIIIVKVFSKLKKIKKSSIKNIFDVVESFFDNKKKKNNK